MKLILFYDGQCDTFHTISMMSFTFFDFTPSDDSFPLEMNVLICKSKSLW